MLTSTYRIDVGTRRRRLVVRVPDKEFQRSVDGRHAIPAAFTAAQKRPYLDTIAARLEEVAATRAEALRAAQSLAVNVPYVTDEESTGDAEFVRYPAETLVHGKGDCEDKAALLAGVLSRPPFDCRTALLLLRKHCAALVARSDLPAALVAEDPVTVTLGTVEYAYVEAVAAPPPGEMAPDYEGRPLLAAYNGNWVVLDAGAAVASARKTIAREGIGIVGSFV